MTNYANRMTPVERTAYFMAITTPETAVAHFGAQQAAVIATIKPLTRIKGNGAVEVTAHDIVTVTGEHYIVRVGETFTV